MAFLKKALYTVAAVIGGCILMPLGKDVLIPLGQDIIKNSESFKSLTVSEKEQTAENSYEIIKGKLEGYSKEYIKAHNKGDFSLVNKFYKEDSKMGAYTKSYIDKNSSKFKVNLYDITLKEAPERIGNSSTYNIKTDMEYRYDDAKGQLTKEVVTNRAFQVSLSANNQLIFNEKISGGQSVCYDLEKPNGQNRVDCNRIY
ncbi:TcaA NTF2-like domain-containing protein [Bacillus cereus group sp. MYBK30-1]|uniref:TcaA NTF2-like domain-containing protein n=1 Tax=unclassified Bacillus cereus group TaxID=2750818 RepID=UPI003F7ABF03